MVIAIYQIIRQLVIFSLETGFQYAQFFLYCSNMTEFTEAEIARAIGILRTNGMKLEQVFGQWQQTRHTETFQIKSCTVECTHISV
jgi:hypothetical protein